MTKEEAYDSLIHPLMEQIIKHCVEHKIGIIASFATPTDVDPHMSVTTVMIGGEYPGTPIMRAAAHMWQSSCQPVKAEVRDLEIDGQQMHALTSYEADGTPMKQKRPTGPEYN